MVGAGQSGRCQLRGGQGRGIKNDYGNQAKPAGDRYAVKGRLLLSTIQFPASGSSFLVGTACVASGSVTLMSSIVGPLT